MKQKAQIKIVEFSREEAEAFLKIVDNAVALLHAKIEGDRENGTQEKHIDA